MLTLKSEEKAEKQMSSAFRMSKPHRKIEGNEATEIPLMNTKYVQQAGLGIFFRLVPFPSEKAWYEGQGIVSTRKCLIQRHKDLSHNPGAHNKVDLECISVIQAPMVRWEIETGISRNL